MRHELGSVWSIEVDDTFISRVVDGDHQLMSPGPPIRTIWATVWEPPPEQSPEQVIATILADGPPPRAERLEGRSDDGEVIGIAFWHPEPQEDRDVWVLSSYTARRGSYVQLSCYCDDRADRGWAVGVWHSLGVTS